MGQSNLPTPNSHVEVLYRQTFNTLGGIVAADLTQDNRAGGAGAAQKAANSRLNDKTNKGLLAGSVVAVVGNGLIGAAAGDSTAYDAVVGIVVNDAVGNPYESSSAVASQKVVYMHGTGTCLRTDIYETANAAGGALGTAYAAGQLLYASRNGLLTNASGLAVAGAVGAQTPVGIVLSAPTAADPYMSLQMKV